MIDIENKITFLTQFIFSHLLSLLIYQNKKANEQYNSLFRN